MWLSPVLFAVILILICVWAYRYATFRPKNFPPGPPRLPIYGTYGISLMLNWNFPQFPFERWAKKYGPVFGWYFGELPCVTTNDYDTCREVLSRTVFDGKPELNIARFRSIGQKQLGIFFTDGQFWHEQRRFSLRHMRDFGFGRRFQTLESLMNDQIQSVIEFIKYPKYSPEDKDVLRQDGTVLFPDILYPTMMNSIMSIFGMEVVQPGTERYRHLRDIGRAVLMLQHGVCGISTLNLTPSLKYVVPKITGYSNITKSNDILFPFFKGIIEDIQKTRMDDNEVRNFYDLYINKMKENKDKENNSFTDDQLLMLTIDYMFPAVTAVPVTFVQVIFSLLHHLECRVRMQMEIDEVVGRGRLPTLDDRKDMPYTESVIREVMRKETLVPIGILHRTLEETTLRDYTIPKNTLLFTSLHGAHMDKNVWGDPENFRPKRFINSDGTIKKKDYSLPFGAGKRLCAGETFARNSIFLLVSCFFQNFTFKMPDGVKIPKMENKIPGIINSQKDDCWVNAIPRD